MADLMELQAKPKTSLARAVNIIHKKKGRQKGKTEIKSGESKPYRVSSLELTEEEKNFRAFYTNQEQSKLGQENEKGSSL